MGISLGSPGPHGFRARFLTWITACVSTPRFFININGELVGFFSSERGIRQGDPLSIYLFILVMELLYMVLSKKTTEDPNFAFHWRCHQTRTAHLCFADDQMLFCGGSTHSALMLKEALSTFSSLSGLTPNQGKSNVFVAGDNVELKAAICDIFGFAMGSHPVKYLGVPLITTRLSLVDCKILVDRLIARTQSWTSKALSYAGHLQLIQSVLFNIQVHCDRL